MSDNDNQLRELVAQVAASYFANSHVGSNEIPTVVNQIAASLKAVTLDEPAPAQAEAEPETPKATRSQIAKSITDNGLISFEDGRAYKTLRRHLATRGLTPEQYRQKHGLPNDYPMVAPSYSRTRSELAKTLGLGQKGGRRAAAPAAEAAEESAPAEPKAPAKRGRPKKNAE